MRSAAIGFAHQIRTLGPWDAMVTGNMMEVATLRGIIGTRPPILHYFHENQLTYPLQEGESRDLHYGFTDMINCLTADRIAFNSRYHLEDFLKAAVELSDSMPEKLPVEFDSEIRRKSAVLYPGCAVSVGNVHSDSHRPFIIWNHRWEYDKDPVGLCRIFEALIDAAVDVDLAILGVPGMQTPECFTKLREAHGDRIVAFGDAADRDSYESRLHRGAVVLSTARQEFFGISTVEAIMAGCLPVLPDRLAYPEIIPKEYHDRCLYSTTGEAVEKIRRHITEPGALSGVLSSKMRRFSWECTISRFDSMIDSMIESKEGSLRSI
jgi:glycosyltransferase involved in cell wall biosynthesis